jgi:peptidoglycan-N-acetylglucosamine deacetylase
MTTKPFASLSLDLDNKWSYLKTHGDSGWETFPSYLDTVVPRALEFFKERKLNITFFIVGQDAALDKNRDALAQIGSSRHEVGNHSFHHEPWLHLYPEAEIEAELSQAEDAIEQATHRHPVGFRGPGFIFSSEILNVLIRRGYEYDASTFPTYLGPLARAYYFMTTKLTKEEKQERKELFGRMREGLRPVKPYRWQTENQMLLEIPVTTMPLLKVPIHASYILYLSVFSKQLALSYFKMALRLCRATKTEPSLLLHPLDFLGEDDTKDLSFFPAMRMASRKKIEVVNEVLRLLQKDFEVVSLGEYARTVASRSAALPCVKPNFSSPRISRMRSVSTET